MRHSRSHLDQLESESIHILREVYSEFKNPVLMYSIGKDSSVLLHLAKKAFYPSKLSIPLLHVDTGWKFKEMIEFRDRIAKENKLDLIVWRNALGVKQKISPLEHGSDIHTRIMKTDALKQALDHHQFDGVIGGARRDEEKSRAKERVFSFRDKNHSWDPKKQRPEFWSNFNTSIAPGQSIRVFPLSNWTELDIWSYIEKEKIEIVPLYFAAKRDVIKRNGQIIMVDDERLCLEGSERIEQKNIRFRTLGCYPFTAAILSEADTIQKVIAETKLTKKSERSGRLIDSETGDSMEDKKKEGYF